jgi:thioredoxin-related protein
MHLKHSLIKFVGSITLILVLSLTQKEVAAQEISQKPALEWYSDFEMAKQEADVNGKYVMLYFSGSDWCKPCIQLNKNILETETFSDYAKGNFVPVKLDFPKMRKNRQSKKSVSYNENLADRFNPNALCWFSLITMKE